MRPVPGLAARLSAVLGREVTGDELAGEVLVELLQLLEHLLQQEQRP